MATDLATVLLMGSFPPFSGKGRDEYDAYSWVVRLERQCPSDETRLMIALSRLTRDAACWSEAYRFNTWEEFRTAFLARYGEKPKVSRARFNECRQGPGEGVQVYADRFRYLGSRVPNLDHADLLERFVSGLSDDLYPYVAISRPTCLDEAVNLALYHEGLVQSRERQNPKPKPWSPPPRTPDRGYQDKRVRWADERPMQQGNSRSAYEPRGQQGDMPEPMQLNSMGEGACALSAAGQGTLR
jgi:hypothetical protein